MFYVQDSTFKQTMQVFFTITPLFSIKYLDLSHFSFGVWLFRHTVPQKVGVGDGGYEAVEGGTDAEEQGDAGEGGCPQTGGVEDKGTSQKGEN